MTDQASLDGGGHTGRGCRFPPTLWIGTLGSVAFFLLLATKNWFYALFGIPYLMIFLDKRGDIGCAMAVLGFVVSLPLSYYSVALVGIGTDGNDNTRESTGAGMMIAFFLCQCVLVHGAWRFSRRAEAAGDGGGDAA